MIRLLRALYEKNTFLLVLLLLIGAFIASVSFNKESNTDIQSSNDSSPQVKIFTPEFGVVSALIGMGYQPYAMGEKEEYHTWVSKKPLDKSIKDVGLRFFPNVEQLRFLDADVIIDTDFYALMRPHYPKHIPVVTVDIGMDRPDIFSTPTWQDYRPTLTTISKLINKDFTNSQHANFVVNYTNNHKQRLQTIGDNIKQLMTTKDYSHINNNTKFAIVNMYDTKSLSFTAENTPNKMALDTMGLQMATRGVANRYGNATVSIDELFSLSENTCLIVKRPLTPFFKSQLADSMVWKKSRFSKKDACVYTIDSTWSVAGIEAATEFAQNLYTAIRNKDNELANLTQ